MRGCCSVGGDVGMPPGGGSRKIEGRYSRDRNDWDAMRATYHPDSFVHLSWYRGSGPGFVDASQGMHDQHAWRASHRLSPPLVTLRADKASAEVGVAIAIRQPLDGVEVDVTSYGRLLYRVRRAPDCGWLITDLTMIYELDTLVPVLPGALPSLDVADLARYRPSYRYLSYLAQHSGGEPSADLPGDDRPHLVAAVYESASSWLDTDRD
jgi:SnoaL-like domain